MRPTIKMFSFLFFSFSSLALYAQKRFCFSDFYGIFNMLIDTSGNQYLLCPNENSYARHSGNNNKYFESDDNRCYSWTRARALEKVNYITKNS